MNTKNKKFDAANVLEFLEQAWACYTPAPVQPILEEPPELIEFANAA